MFDMQAISVSIQGLMYGFMLGGVGVFAGPETVAMSGRDSLMASRQT